jgi:GTP cyclohydrolase I
VDTPARVLRSLTEMTAGYSDDVGAHLNVQFDVPTHGGLVLVDGIQFTSLCEHHMLPFVGTAAVGYRPGERVVGLSKLARTVHTFAKRLQVQERMTEQIADALNQHLEPEGAGVVIRATHSCMAARGALQPASSMQTQAFRGSLSDSERALILASV